METTYSPLDVAFKAAEDGATIVLLKDGTLTLTDDLTEKNNKTWTFTGTGKITIDSVSTNAMRVPKGKKLTYQGEKLSLEIRGDNK